MLHCAAPKLGVMAIPKPMNVEHVWRNAKLLGFVMMVWDDIDVFVELQLRG